MLSLHGYVSDSSGEFRRPAGCVPRSRPHPSPSSCSRSARRTSPWPLLPPPLQRYSIPLHPLCTVPLPMGYLMAPKAGYLVRPFRGGIPASALYPSPRPRPARTPLPSLLPLPTKIPKTFPPPRFSITTWGSFPLYGTSVILGTPRANNRSRVLTLSSVHPHPAIYPPG